MTYQTNVPNAGQSPGLFPAQANDNFTRIKTIVGANHKFNDSAAADDGYHQNIKILPIGVPGNDGSVGQAFVNTSDATNQLFYKDGLNRVFQMTPTLPVYAAVKFVGTAASPITGANILYGFNVSSIDWTVAGQYNIRFNVNLPSRNYIVLGMIQSASQTGIVRSFSGTYNQAFDTTFTIVQTFNLSNSLATFQTVQVLVLGG